MLPADVSCAAFVAEMAVGGWSVHSYIYTVDMVKYR